MWGSGGMFRVSRLTFPKTVDQICHISEIWHISPLRKRLQVCWVSFWEEKTRGGFPPVMNPCPSPPAVNIPSREKPLAKRLSFPLREFVHEE